MNDLPPEHKLGVGVDRLDYTKGIMERFRAIERLLELNPEWIGRFTFVQIAAPTRAGIEEYQHHEAQVRAMAARINERFGRHGPPPIVLKVEHHEPREVYEYFRAADLCFVSSLHDGMNLVAKEFVAARDDERGVLILSQFTGAARELPEALIVNPYDADQCAAALHLALTMPADEQRDRMRLMRGLVAEFNVFRWAGRMLLDAAAMRRRSRLIDKADRRGGVTMRRVVASRSQPRLGLFSRCRRHADRHRRHAGCRPRRYGAARSDRAPAPGQRRRRGAGQRSRHIRSGEAASARCACRWPASTGWNGAMLPGRLWMHAAPPAAKCAIKEALAPVLARHPGLLLEDKGLTLALHYRLAPHLAAYVQRLMARLAQDADAGLEVQRGKRVAEVKPSGIDKGTAVAEYLAESPFMGRRPVFIGDDLNDEHGFAEVNKLGGISIKVGKGKSCARFRLPDVAAVRRWLGRCIERKRNEQPGSGLDRQLHHRCPDRRAGDHHLGLLPAFRRRPGVLLPAQGNRRLRIFCRRARGLRTRRAALSGKHRDPDHAHVRPSRRRDRSHGFCAALRSIWPHVPAHDAGAPYQAAFRQPAP